MRENITKNVLRISYKFFRNFWTVLKISSKRLEYLINFFCISFSKIFWTFPNNPAEIFKTSFKLYSQNFYINTSIGWKFHKLIFLKFFQYNLNFRKFYTKFPWNFPWIFGNFPQNLAEIFTTFRNFYEFHSQNFYILRKNFINNYGILVYKIYPTILTDQNCWNINTYERR